MSSGTTRRPAPIHLSADEFRAGGHRLVDRIAALLDDLPRRRVTPDATPGALRDLLGPGSLPEGGRDPLELLEWTTELLFEHSLFNGHPRFLGYITSSPAPIGMLADLLAAAVNANVGAWRLSPMASEIEGQTIRWLADLVGLPEGSGGLMVSGGTMANLVGLLAARHAAGGSGRPRVYASRGTHTWLEKAVNIAGLGRDVVVRLPVDRDERLDVAALDRAIAEDVARGARPLMVVANAGTVATGAVDPLFDIADICRHRYTWMHVDGCYGAVAARVPGAPPDLAALPLADSVALDPHKWLYAPLEAGAVLVRDPATLRGAFAFDPDYYNFGGEGTDYHELGPQNSRGFRALKVWLALLQVGRAGYVRMMGDDMALARQLADLVAAHPELEPFTCSLGITTFRFVPPDLRPRCGEGGVSAYLDELGAALLDQLQRDGEVFVSHAVVRGCHVLRPCFVNFRTSSDDVRALIAAVESAGRALDAEKRPPGLRPAVRV